MAGNFTLIFYIITALISVSAAIITIGSTFAFAWKKSLSRGQNYVHKGLTIHRENQDGYFLSIQCQKGVEGTDAYFDVRNELVSYEYIYRGKSMLLTASINEQKNTIEIKVIQT